VNARRGNCAAVLIVFAVVLGCSGVAVLLIDMAWEAMVGMTTWLLG